MRGRGLKPDLYELRHGHTGVAPHAGAWIETRLHTEIIYQVKRSPPMRGRGLKHWYRQSGAISGVAPHAGAWIETNSMAGILPCPRSRPPCGGVD